MYPVRVEIEDPSINFLELRIGRVGDALTLPCLLSTLEVSEFGVQQGGLASASAAQPILEWSPTLGSDRLTFEDAKKLAESQTIGGHSDWRLPTIQELLTLVDYTRHDPSIDTARFPDTKSSYYWSSSPYAAAPGCAWIVYFGSGGTDWNPRGYNSAFVRAVRSVPASQ